MTALAQANAVAVADAEVSEQASSTNPSNEPNGVPVPVVPEVPELDEYGRDAAERTVELSPRDAEAVDAEVLKGKWQTYDDALAYVIARGLAEIKRQRDAAEAQREKSVLKTTRDLYSNMLRLNPALVADAKFVAKMIADLGVSKKS